MTRLIMQGHLGACRKSMGTQGNTEEYKGITDNIGEHRVISREMCK
jgi:hypothetical protein